MNDTYIVTSYVVMDDILKAYAFEEDCRARGSAAEILAVAVMAAKYCQNHHERALYVMVRLGYVKGLSISRFNRRLHALHDWLEGIVRLLAEVFIMDSMPLPVCKRVRASRCKKVRGKPFVAIVLPKRRNSLVGVYI